MNHGSAKLRRLFQARSSEFRATAATTATSFGLQGVLIVSGVLAARILGVTDRGELALLWLITLIVAQLGSLGVPAAITYFIANGRMNGRAVLHATRRLLTLQCLGLVLAQAGLLFAFLHSAKSEVMWAAGTTLLAMPSLMLHQYGLAMLQGRQQFRLYNIQRALPAVLYGGSLVLVLALGRRSLVVVTSAWVASVALGGIATFVVAYVVADCPAASGSNAPATVREMLRFGSRALLGVFTGFEQLQLDQAIVGLVLSTHALGLYVVAIAFSNLPRFVGQSIGFVAFPAVARVTEPRDIPGTLWRFFKLGAVSCAVIVVGLLASVPVVLPAFFGPSFRPAVSVAEILLVGALFQSIRRVLSEAARGAGYPMLGTLAELSSWLILLPSVVLLAPADGLPGIAVAFGIGSAASLGVAAAGLAVLVRKRPAEPKDMTVPLKAAAPADPALPEVM